MTLGEVKPQMIDDNNISISQMLELSYELWDIHRDSWHPMEPEFGKNFILYMIEEVGEAIAIIKKKGEDDIMNDAQVREHFVEEMCDVAMYFADVLNRFDISAEEFSQIYMKKFEFNMNRDYEEQYRRIK